MRNVSYRKADVEGFSIFYHEAGPKVAQTLLLLHGFPSASHMFRDLVPRLADRFHVIAPDLPGFGQSDMPDRSAIHVHIPCDRRSPGKEDGCNLKPFEAIQRVRLPPGRGAARQPEASPAREAATSLAKRRQRKLKPCVSLEIMYPLRPSVWFARGRCRHDR